MKIENDMCELLYSYLNDILKIANYVEKLGSDVVLSDKYKSDKKNLKMNIDICQFILRTNEGMYKDRFLIFSKKGYELMTHLFNEAKVYNDVIKLKQKMTELDNFIIIL